MAKILIVEDDTHIAAVMDLWLRQHGHEIVHAENGEAALALLERDLVDLIVSDVNMPRVDGLQFVKTVRLDRHLDVPILLVTSRCDQPQLAEEMKRYQVTLYPKPFMPSRLVAEIDRLLDTVAT